ELRVRQLQLFADLIRRRRDVHAIDVGDQVHQAQKCQHDRRGASHSHRSARYRLKPMKYRPLADTGVFVSELCLGTMTFGGKGIWEVIGGIDQGAVDEIVHRSLDAGINFIDTANVYGLGESETMVGKALGARRHEIVLATKVRGRMSPGANDVGLSRLHITNAVDASLKR